MEKITFYVIKYVNLAGRPHHSECCYDTREVAQDVALTLKAQGIITSYEIIQLSI